MLLWIGAVCSLKDILQTWISKKPLAPQRAASCCSPDTAFVRLFACSSSSFPSTLKCLEPLLVALLLVVAAWLRFDHLATLPGGFHGDEAVAGLEGERILREGSIGPYSPLALGQPSGPLYLTALSIRFFGPTIWAVRAPSALLGTLTVALLYFLLRRHEGRRVALLGAAFLATLDWHIFFSRIGFPVVAWPLCALAATFAALEAARRERARWWALTGLLAGVGIYSYNAHILFILALFVWLALHLARQREVARGRRVGWGLCFAAMVALVALPMARYALNPANDYFAHSRMVTVWNVPDSGWPQEEGSFAKIRFLSGQYVGFWDNLSWHSQIDWSDGTGIVAAVPLMMLVLAVLGPALRAKNRRSALLAISLCCLLFLPFGPALTSNAPIRRAFALAPFLCFLAAVGAVEVWKRACAAGGPEKTRCPRRLAATGVLALGCALLVTQNLFDYFERFARSPQRAWVYVQDYTDMCAFLQHLAPGSHVLFLSDRWSAGYEPRQFLAPRAVIEDRSSQFGILDLRVNRAMERPVFVLMGLYQTRLPELRRLYPHCRVGVGPPSADTGKPAFIVVWPGPRDVPPDRSGAPLFPMPPGSPPVSGAWVIPK